MAVLFQNTSKNAGIAYNPLTGEATIPVSGTYELNYGLCIQSSFPTRTPATFSALIGVTPIPGGICAKKTNSADAQTDTAVVSLFIDLTAGDIITVRNLGVTPIDLVGPFGQPGIQAYLNIKLLSTP